MYNDHVFGMKAFSSRTWDRIEKECAAASKTETDVPVEAEKNPHLRNYRRTLFIASSPVLESD